MKKIVRIFTLVMAILVLFGVSSCNWGQNTPPSGGDTPTPPVTDDGKVQDYFPVSKMNEQHYHDCFFITSKKLKIVQIIQ